MFLQILGRALGWAEPGRGLGWTSWAGRAGLGWAGPGWATLAGLGWHLSRPRPNLGFIS